MSQPSEQLKFTGATSSTKPHNNNSSNGKHKNQNRNNSGRNSGNGKSNNNDLLNKLSNLERTINRLHKGYNFKSPDDAFRAYQTNDKFKGQLNTMYSQNKNNPLFQNYVDTHLADKIVDHLLGNSNVNPAEREKIKLAILVDDWPTVLTQLLPYVQKVPELWNRGRQMHSIWTSKRGIGDKISATFSLPSLAHDAKILAIENAPSDHKWNSNSAVSSAQFSGGGFTSNSSVRSANWDLADPRAVNKQAIAASLYPEGNWYPQVSNGDSMNQISGGRQVTEFNIVSSTAGGAGFHFFPKNCMSPATVLPELPIRRASYGMVYSGTGFSAVTGVLTTAPQYLEGPFYDPNAFTTGFALNSYTVEFIPRAALLNAAGTIHTAWGNEPPNTTYSDGSATTPEGVVAIGRSQLLLMKTVRTTDARSNFRRTVLLNTSDTYNMHTLSGPTDCSNLSSWFYMLVEGVPLGVVIGTLKVTCTIDYVPTLAMMVKVPVFDVPQGPATQALRKNIFRFAMNLLELDRSSAMQLANDLMACTSCDLDAMQQIIIQASKLASNVTTLAYNPNSDPKCQIDDGMISFDSIQ